MTVEYIYKRIYGIDICSIKEIVEELAVTKLFRTPEILPGVTNLRGKILAVINIGELFKLQAANNKNTKRKFIIITEPNGKEAALTVDNIIEVKWINENDFQDIPETIENEEKKFLSALIQTNASPIPVIDAKKLLEDEIWKKITGGF